MTHPSKVVAHSLSDRQAMISHQLELAQKEGRKRSEATRRMQLYRERLAAEPNQPKRPYIRRQRDADDTRD